MRSALDPDLTPAEAGLRAFERRRENRIQVRLPVNVIGKGLGGELSHDGMCTDICEAGVSFESDFDFYVGDIVDLQFRGQDAELFNFQVRLLSKVGDRYGGYFVSYGRRP